MKLREQGGSPLRMPIFMDCVRHFRHFPLSVWACLMQHAQVSTYASATPNSRPQQKVSNLHLHQYKPTAQFCLLIIIVSSKFLPFSIPSRSFKTASKPSWKLALLTEPLPLHYRLWGCQAAVIAGGVTSAKTFWMPSFWLSAAYKSKIVMNNLHVVYSPALF